MGSHNNNPEKNNKFEIIYHTKPPYDFLHVGKNPLRGMTFETAKKYDIFINLTLDQIQPKTNAEYYHIPIDESEFWGYDAILKAKIILDKAF